MASAFVHSACRHGFTATYVRAPRLLHELAVSRGDGSYARLLAKHAKLDLLAIDDWLLAPLTDAERRDLLEIIEDRSERVSTLIASQLPPTAWHAAIWRAQRRGCDLRPRDPSGASTDAERADHARPGDTAQSEGHIMSTVRRAIRGDATGRSGLRSSLLRHPRRSWITERACGPCPSHGKRHVRVSHSSLDGAQNAPPTTAHKALMGFTDEEQMRKMTRLAKGGSRG